MYLAYIKLQVTYTTYFETNTLLLSSTIKTNITQQKKTNKKH
jgi:hypothetical protein